MTFFLSIPLLQAYTQSDFFGKCIFISLFLLSFVSWVLLIHKIKVLQKVRKLASQFELFFEKNKENILSLKIDVFSHPHYEIYKVLKQKTLEILNKNRSLASASQETPRASLSPADIDLIAAHLDMIISRQNKFFEKNLFILPTAVTLAPFLGLLGTVWGILLTFSHLQTHSLSSSNASVLSGLSMALATTVLGLVIAIPALISHNYLKNGIKHFSEDMEIFARQLLASIEMQYRIEK